jgi:alpha-tubulin suppressor-like RCC1 family protein
VKEFDDNYSDDPIEPENSKGSVFSKLFSFVGIGALLVVGSTFAANINLNSGQRVEFGQGISIVTSCDSQVTLTPRASFVNASGSGSFYFSSFTLSNVDVTACNGVSFTLKAFGNTSSDPLTLFSTNNSAVINDSSTAFVVAANQSGLTLSDTSTTGAFTANFSSPVALASDVYKITFETSGNGTSSVSSVTVSAFTFSSIASGYTDTCGITSDGSVYCWGRSGYGQLGNGTSSVDSNVPVQAIGISAATQIALGNSYACALISGGTVKCWGHNGNGALGIGDTNESAIYSSPQNVSGVSSVTAIGVYGSGACATLSSGSIKCWGYALGINGGGVNVSSPTSISGISTASYATNNGNFGCALLSNSTINCWGYNAQGYLGNGNTTNTYTPAQVSGITNASQISVGGNSSCALLTTGSLKCWGFNSSGQMGNGTNTSPNSTPVSVTGITTATQISVGGSNACALISGGTIKCWGGYGQGMLGTNTNVDSYTPVVIAGISNATKVSVGDSHACAILSGGQVKCWGDNSYGQFGNGTTTSSATPS